MIVEGIDKYVKWKCFGCGERIYEGKYHDDCYPERLAIQIAINNPFGEADDDWERALQGVADEIKRLKATGVDLIIAKKDGI